MANRIDISTEVKNVLKIEAQALLDCASKVNEPPYKEQLEKSITLLEETLRQNGKIIITGVGKSGKVGQKLAATLSSTGSLAVFLHPTEGLHGDLGVIRSNDVIIALSYTGNTDELITLLNSLERLNVPIIGLGSNKNSKLAQLCHSWIDTSVEKEACPNNLAPTSSTTLALAIGDAIAVTLMKIRGFQAKDFALNHPGGGLGKRLSMRVKDLMHKGSNVGTLSQQDSIHRVIEVLTETKLGGALVVENQTLIGLITDGDIRRALQKKEGFFQLKAADLMSEQPINIEANEMLTKALELMENRQSQISVLPVVDKKTMRWEGLLRLHDVAQNL